MRIDLCKKLKDSIKFFRFQTAYPYHPVTNQPNVIQKGNGEEGPLRAEVLSHDQMIMYATALGESVQIEPYTRGHTVNLIKRFRDNAQFIKSVYNELSESASRGRPLTIGGEWLLDNYYILERNVRDVSILFPKGYYYSLPQVSEGLFQGFPRVYLLAVELLSATDASIDTGVLTDFIRAYQASSYLSIGELWAMPLMLRLALIENLRRLISINYEYWQELTAVRRDANTLLANNLKPSEILSVFSDYIRHREVLSSVEFVEYSSALKSIGSKASLTLEWLNRRVQEQGCSGEELVEKENRRQAADRVSISNTITSLKMISNADWSMWFDANSKLEHALSHDLNDVYAYSDFTTRDMCRKQIEIYARRMRVSELEIAATLLAFKRDVFQQNIRNPIASDVKKQKQSNLGYYLIEEGRASFEAHIKYKETWYEKTIGLLKSNSFTLYFSSFCFLTLFVLITHWLYLRASSGVVLATIVSLCALVPLSELVISLIHWLVGLGTSPNILPKLYFKQEIPVSAKTAVIVHVVIGSTFEIDEAVEKLEVRYLGNSEGNIVFFLLCDLKDSDTEVCDTDEQLIDYADASVSVLNERYKQEGTKKFFCLVRGRTWHESDEKYFGWERKRGKVHELNSLILEGAKTTFLNVTKEKQQALEEVTYVITLDADTTLPYGSAKRLIETISHPLNIAECDDQKKVVRKGYVIIQPRISVSLSSGFSSIFASLFSDCVGLDPYTSGISEVSQDILGESYYLGKGIYDVRMFEKVLKNRAPEQTLLSHDLFESFFARTAFASDIELFDEFPSHYRAYTKRLQRWVRGDWQLFPWLGNRVLQADGSRVANVLSLHKRWKIIDNMRRSLVTISCTCLLFVAWFSPSVSNIYWTSLVVCILSLPIYIHFTSNFRIPLLRLSLRPLIRGFVLDIRKDTERTFLTIAFLPYQALAMFSAICRTFWRMGYSRKRLLQWDTASSVECMMRSNVVGALISMLVSAVFLMVLAAILLHYRGITPISGTMIVLWFFAPFFAYFVSLPHKNKQSALKIDECKYLESIAFETWNFFLDHLTVNNNFLVPDNIQIDSIDRVARRSSPTNIGLSLLATLSAYDLGLITRSKLLSLTDAILTTVCKLEKHRGHLYNWYDIDTMKPLHPFYVSTVDSGNFIGHLIATSEGLRDLNDTALEDTSNAIDNRNQVPRLIETIDNLVNQTDFTFLYNSSIRLFSIGFDVESGHLDRSHYDLLASEARLTSLIAIAKHDVSIKHWFALGRSLGSTVHGVTLLSWCGTMFEYLMPLLVLKDYKGTLLSESSKVAVQVQRDYGRRKGIQWGISESAFAGVNAEHIYQYQSFGVPELGLKRALSENLVVSPYASFLALMVDHKTSLRNIKALEQKGLRGKYGFYESIDYVKSRLKKEEKSHIVKAYFAHHQGMSLAAINNLLNDSILQKRFHRYPSIQSVNLLLQERCPNRVLRVQSLTKEGSLSEEEIQTKAGSSSTMVDTPHTGNPKTHLITNHNYTVMIDNAGSGFSKTHNHLAVTRWHPNRIQNDLGSYMYVRDLESGKLWSNTFQPTCMESESYEVIYNADKAEFKRKDFGIVLHTAICVSPDDNVEVRRITVTNVSPKRRIIELTSYGEVVLGNVEADWQHPAFSKLFIESEVLNEFDALLFQRYEHSGKEKTLHMFHMMTSDIVWERTQFETCRRTFLGRNRTVHNPVCFTSNDPLTGTVGSVLDPIFSIRTRIELDVGMSHTVSFVTGIADSKSEAVQLVSHYHDAHTIDRTFNLAWSHSDMELRSEPFGPSSSCHYQELANLILFPSDKVSMSIQPGDDAFVGKRHLWSCGVSGDIPIVLLVVSNPGELLIVKELLAAHHYLKRFLLEFDLVILNAYPEGYLQEFQQRLNAIVHQYDGDILHKRGGVFNYPLKQIASEAEQALRLFASVTLHGNTNLQKQLQRKQRSMAQTLHCIPGQRTFESLRPNKGVITEDLPTMDESLTFYNGYGGFTDEGDVYQINSSSHSTPLPWINVVSNPDFGFIVSETGSGYTWSENSQMFRLSPWNNDAVSDCGGEAVYCRDKESGHFWSPTSFPCGGASGFKVQHGKGYSKFISEHQNVITNLCLSGCPEERVKLWTLELHNVDIRKRNIEIYLYIELLLADYLRLQSAHVVTNYDESSETIIARNVFEEAFSDTFVFVGASVPIRSYTCDRSEFIGLNRTVESPIVFDRIQRQARTYAQNKLEYAESSSVTLSGKTGMVPRPCSALQVSIEMNAGEKQKIHFYLGCVADVSMIKEKVEKFSSDTFPSTSLLQSSKFWRELQGVIEVVTPDQSFDLLVNKWLLYQVVSSRLFGRTAFYQSSGAYGFRDQLQDVTALVYTRPDLTRQHLLRCASRQFPEGDVQHWWHFPTGQGVRTRISDDYLWLPYVLSYYIKITGDHSLLYENVPFIDGPLLEPDQEECYLEPEESKHSVSMYQHCVTALENSMSFGIHGLPLIGTGDWNDGFNSIGKDGDGESVWLAWFLYSLLTDFAEIAKIVNDPLRTSQFTQEAVRIKDAIEISCWDGQWYVRAFYDDGTPLGSSKSFQCQIDSLAQSWGIISGAASLERSKVAFDALIERLVDYETPLIRLLTPPFTRIMNGQEHKFPGYIANYPPGIRENGGQYCHAAAWVVLACTKLGDGNKAFELFRILNPIEHSLSPKSAKKYMTEPYAVCGDTYSVEPYRGRGGWSWYTGAAAWLYRIAIENIIGLNVQGDWFTVNPCIPSSWESFSCRYQRNKQIYHIHIENPNQEQSGIERVFLEGRDVHDKRIIFSHQAEEGEFVIRAIMGSSKNSDDSRV